MTERTSREIIARAIDDFDDIRDAIRGHRVAVPYPTPTSLYGELIANIRIGSLSGSHKRFASLLILNELIGEKTGIFKGVIVPAALVSGAAESAEND